MNENGKLDYNDMLRFMNVKIDPLPPALPINIKVLLLVLFLSLFNYKYYIYLCTIF